MIVVHPRMHSARPRSARRKRPRRHASTSSALATHPLPHPATDGWAQDEGQLFDSLLRHNLLVPGNLHELAEEQRQELLKHKVRQ